MSNMLKGYVVSTFSEISKCSLRCIASTKFGDDEIIIAGGRDGVLTIMKYSPRKIEMINTIQTEEEGISSLCILKAGTWHKSECICSGMRDGSYSIWTIEQLIKNESKPLYNIQTHEDNVCFVGQSNDGKIISCGWDQNFAIREFEKKATRVLLGNNGWAACDIGFGYFIACADKALRVVDYNGSIIQTIAKAHEDCIRGCKFIPEKNIVLTVSNDGSVREWTIKDGKIETGRIAQLTDVYLYDICINGDNLFAIGEDKVVFVVDIPKMCLIDTVPIGSTEWGIVRLPFGDIAIATENRGVFVITNNVDHSPTDEITSQFFKNLEETEIKAPQLENVDISEFPELPNDDTPIGVMCAIRSNSTIYLVLFSKGYDQWVKVGHLKKSNRNKVVDEDGNEYDTSVTTFIDDDFTPQKLYVKFSETPETSARRFMEKHNITSKNYFNQIVEFLKMNLGDGYKRELEKMTEKAGNINGLEYAVADTIGRKFSMEDKNFVIGDEKGNSVFAIFDGHGGKQASEYAQNRVPELIKERRTEGIDFWVPLYVDLQKEMIPKFQICGTTALMASFEGDKMVITSLGDSRAVLCRTPALRVSFDHKPQTEEEYVVAQGGSVSSGRIVGILGTGRALGDGEIAKYLNPEPFLAAYEITNGDRLVMACDGLWDVVSDDEAAEIVRKAENPLDAAKMLRNVAFERMSADNITVIVIFK